jgi:TPR repeat protein
MLDLPRSLAAFAVIVCAVLSQGCRTYTGAVNASQQTCVECALRDSDPAALPDAGAQFEQGCDEGDPRSCSILGVMLQEGRGGLAQDATRAKRLFNYACLHGNVRACVSLGKIIEHKRADVAGASAMYELACYGGDAEGCYHLGRVRSIDDDMAAIDPLERGCKAGNGPSCELLGSMYQHGRGVASDMRRARSLYRDACAHGRAELCGW